MEQVIGWTVEQASEQIYTGLSTEMSHMLWCLIFQPYILCLNVKRVRLS